MKIIYNLKSIWYQISPNDITLKSNIKVLRINEIIYNLKSILLLDKFVVSVQ